MGSYTFAIIGCGKIAERHAEEIKKHGQLIAVCDIVREKADSFAEKNSAKPYNDIDSLLREKDIDIVSVCTPNGLHALHSIKSLKAGKHVLCEKPMAIAIGDGQEMIKAEKETGKRLFVVKQNRYNPPVVFLKKFIEQEKLGRIFSFQMNCFWNRPKIYYQSSSWRGTKEMDGGILFTQFSHFIDLLYWLLGDVSTAEGDRKNFLHKDSIEFEDAGVALLKMTNGAIGCINYTINSENKNMEGSLTLFGEKGTVKIGGQYLNELEYFSVLGESRPDLAAGKAANQYGFYEGSMSNHDRVYEHLMKAINDPSYDFISSAETLKTIEIIEKIYNASPLD